MNDDVKESIKRHDADLAEIQARLTKLEDTLKVIQKEK